MSRVYECRVVQREEGGSGFWQRLSFQVATPRRPRIWRTRHSIADRGRRIGDDIGHGRDHVRRLPGERRRDVERKRDPEL